MEMSVYLRRLTMLALFTLFTLFTLFSLTTTAEAGNRTGAFSLSSMAGYQVFADSEDFQDSALFSLSLGYNLTKNWGVELVGTTANVDHKTAGVSDSNYWTARGDLLYHFNPDQNLVPYLAAGVGYAFMNTGNSTDEDPIGNFGGGIKYFVTDTLALRLDARYLIRHEMDRTLTTSGDYFNNFIFSSGLTFQFGGGKAAVVKEADPVVKEVAVVMPADADGDGVIDSLDLCAATPAGSVVDARGCEPIVEPVVAAVVVAVADADADGVPDGNDQCPDTPAAVAVNDLGCPTDGDQDGVFDINDKCLNTEIGKAVDAEGCEIITLAVDELNLGISFGSNSSEIGPQFNEQLQKAADFIKAHPDMKIIIEGYTDNSGSAALNQQLSQKRADTVRWVLIRDYAVDSYNLKAKGFGDKNPIANNTTSVGRSLNRRVIAKALD